MNQVRTPRNIRAQEKGRLQAGLFCRFQPFRRGKNARATQTAYFFGAIASFAAFATRNFTTVFALI